MTWSGLLGAHLRQSGTGNGIAALVFDAACGILRHVPGSTRSAQRGSIPRRSVRRGGEAAGFPASCEVGLLLAREGSSQYHFFRRPLCGGDKLLGAV